MPPRVYSKADELAERVMRSATPIGEAYDQGRSDGLFRGFILGMAAALLLLGLAYGVGSVDVANAIGSHLVCTEK